VTMPCQVFGVQIPGPVCPHSVILKLCFMITGNGRGDVRVLADVCLSCGSLGVTVGPVFMVACDREFFIMADVRFPLSVPPVTAQAHF
jgi:hypothetical protein